MTTHPPRLAVDGLSKRYGPRPVLVDIDLTVGPGAVVAVTGVNGSGKSTLLRCVAGLARHDGTIRIDGLPVPAARERIGYLPQSVGFPAWPTVGEVLAFFARLRGTVPTSHPFPTGFVPDADRFVRHLSGGQRQRVALAVAFLGAPRLMLLDEPAASLDDEGRMILAGAVAHVAAAGVTTLVATPRSDDLGASADRVVALDDGHLVSDLSPPRLPRLHDGGPGPIARVERMVAS